MRKRFLSYITIVIVMFVVGVNVVKAEDYSYGVRVFKIDNPFKFAIEEDMDISNYEEILANGTVSSGDIIGVGIYEIKKTNVNGRGAHIELNWDDEVLEPWEYNGNQFNISDTKTGFGGSFLNYYNNNKPLISISDYNGGKNVFGEKFVFWSFYTIKDDLLDESIFTFSFKKAVKIIDFGQNFASVTTNPVSFKVVKDDFQDNLLGDVNANGKIDFGDVAMLSAYVGRVLTFTPEQSELADLTGDGKIDIADQIKLINMYNTLDKN